MADKIFALVDCNSFFCSCERLFRPDIKDGPIGVLSNNDGCFVSRCPKLKKIGVKMGDPYFKVKDLCDKNSVFVFSSNFSLYTNISHRVMNVLSFFAPRMEVYSVDEAFLDLSGMDHNDLESYSREIKDTVELYTGIPVCVGIGPSKTLAKLANNLAKSSLKAEGVVVLMQERWQEAALKRVGVQDIWGIGKQMGLKCKMLGIKTALDFREYKNTKYLRKVLTKTGTQTQDELKGISCFELEEIPKSKKEIITSRTFSKGITDIKKLKECVADYINLASEKMRSQESVCSLIEVFCRTNSFSEELFYSAKDHTKSLCASSDTRVLIQKAWDILEVLYKSGHLYKKAGIKLSSLSDKNEYQLSFLEKSDDTKSIKLMEVMDLINKKEGYQVIKPMACSRGHDTFKMKQEMKSPRYLHGWSELKKVN